MFAPSWHGFDVVVSDLLGVERVQTRFPRTKRKRVRRKWEKDPRNWTTRHTKLMYRVGNTIVCSPTAYPDLLSVLREN